MSTRPAAIVLCGGGASRFGGEKALAEVGGRAVIHRVIRAVGPLVGRVVAVTAAETPDLRLPAEIAVVADRYPGTGPLGGICTGLLQVPAAPALVVGCDMPFLNADLLRLLLDLADGFDAVVPRLGSGHLEPLHAVYSPACLPKLEGHLAGGRLALWRVLRELHTRCVEEEEYGRLDPEGLSFFNLNSSPDVERADRIAADLAGRGLGD